MSTLASLRNMGVEVNLAPNKQVRVAGLDRLYSGSAIKALALVHQHKTKLLAELQAEAKEPVGWRDDYADELLYYQDENGDKPENQYPKQQQQHANALPRLTLNSMEIKEILASPPETQRVFSTMLDYFKNKKEYNLTQSEALAYTTTKALIKKFGGPVALIDSISVEVAKTINDIKERFYQ